jgi:hypothetical protein
MNRPDLRAKHKAALAVVKTLPVGAKRRELLVRCDALAREIRAVETRAEK